MVKKKMSLEVVNPNASGIDVGSRSHWVSVGQNSQDVKEFGVYSEDYHNLCNSTSNLDNQNIFFNNPQLSIYFRAYRIPSRAIS